MVQPVADEAGATVRFSGGVSLPRISRITRADTFRSVARHGWRVREGPLSFTHLAKAEATQIEVGYAIPRGVGSAVERNLLRRRLRHLISELSVGSTGHALPAGQANFLPAGALVIAARPPVGELAFSQLRSMVSTGVRRLAVGPRAVQSEVRPAGRGSPSVASASGSHHG